MARRTYDAQTKAQVMAALLEGQSVSSVAARYEIPKGTVSKWKRLSSKGVAQEATQKSNLQEIPIGDLLLELLKTNVESLIAISRATQDPEWIKSQDAAELGTFFGVKHDKVVRLIESLNAQNDAEA